MQQASHRECQEVECGTVEGLDGELFPEHSGCARLVTHQRKNYTTASVQLSF